MAYLRLPIESVAKPGWNPGTPVYFGFSGTEISTEVGMTCGILSQGDSYFDGLSR